MKGGGRNGEDGREGGKEGRGKEGWWEEEIFDANNGELRIPHKFLELHVTIMYLEILTLKMSTPNLTN